MDLFRTHRRHGTCSVTRNAGGNGVRHILVHANPTNANANDANNSTSSNMEVDLVDNTVLWQIG